MKLDGVFQEGDEVRALIGPPANDGTAVLAQVGHDGVTRIVVDFAAGPMGWYAVAAVFKGDELVAYHPLHMMETVRIAE